MGTITLPLLLSDLEAELFEQGRSTDEWEAWAPVVAQVRISSADTKDQRTSTSPERQLKLIARYCAKYRYRPVELCFEAQSGRLTDRRPRRRFEDCFERLQSGALDVVAIITYNIDRFTRDRLTGERWLEMLKRRGIDLHEVDEMDPPRPLADREDEYADKLYSASRESKRTRNRQRDRRLYVEAQGYLTDSPDHYGHRPTYAITVDGKRRVAGAEIVPHEAELLREATQRLHEGESRSSILKDFKSRGIRGRNGGWLAHHTLSALLTSPRVAGFDRLSDGTLARRPGIEPILTEEQWLRNRELLAVTPRSKPRSTTLSHLYECAVCGLRMTHDAFSAGPYYTCVTAQRGEPGVCGCGRPEGTCACATTKHPTVHAEQFDRVLLNVALAAASEHQRQTIGAGSVAAPDEITAKRQRLHLERERLSNERRTIARQSRQGLIRQDDADRTIEDLRHRERKYTHEIERLLANGSRNPVRHDLQALCAKAESDSAAARDLIEEVIDRCRVFPRQLGTPRFQRHVEVTFNEPYSLGDNAVKALFEEGVEQRHRARRRRFAATKKWPAGATRRDAEAALRLYEEGFTYNDIVHEFTVTRRPRNLPGAHWTRLEVQKLVDILRGEQGLAPGRRPDHTSRFDYRARELVFMLCSDPTRGWSEIATELNRLGAGDREWNRLDVRACYRTACRVRGENPLDRIKPA